MTVAKNKIGTTCRLVRGDSKPGRFLRTVVRTDLSKIGLPEGFLCPSGFPPDTQGTSACTPFTTLQEVTVMLTAQGTCDAATIQSVKDALTAYLSNPDTAWGVFTSRSDIVRWC